MTSARAADLVEVLGEHQLPAQELREHHLQRQEDLLRRDLHAEVAARDHDHIGGSDD